MEEQSFWHKAMNIDVRIIYTIMFILVAAVMLNPIGLPIPIGDDTQLYYEEIDQLAETGEVLWLDAAFGPGSWGELGPMVEATLRHAFDRGIPVVGMAMWQQGGRMFETAMLNVLEDPEYDHIEYGEHIVNLGFRPGGAAVVLRGATRDVYDTFGGVDHTGQSLDDMPLAMRVERLHPDYVGGAVVYESGSPGAIEYINYVHEPTGMTLHSGVIAMSFPAHKNLQDAGQLTGILGGATGCAQYELLIDHPGYAVMTQDVISIGMVFVTLLIILGNIGWLMTRQQEG